VEIHEKPVCKTRLIFISNPMPVDFMGIALEEAHAAATRNEVPVGAVITRNGQIIARAGNRTRERHDPSAHAELLAIREACQHLNDERLIGCDLYVTLEPCPMCAAAISFARIRRLYFGAFDPKGGAVESGVRLYQSPTCHHAPEVYGGIREQECAAMLKTFFKAKRVDI
jgi:tRNA(adenine34) deaminase